MIVLNVNMKIAWPLSLLSESIFIKDFVSLKSFKCVHFHVISLKFA